MRAAAGAIAAVVAVLGAAAPARADDAVTVGDAYARPGTNACTWSIGTDAIRKDLTFSGGTYELTRFENVLTGSEYVDQSDPSGEFRLTWDGQTLTGASGGWSCASGHAEKVDAGGADALQLDVSVTRDDLRVTKHYVVYPSDALIREWTDYANTGTGSHTLAQPSFMEQHVMGRQIQAGNVNLRYMTGATAVAGSWQLKDSALDPAASRTFDSYDAFGCASDNSQSGWRDISNYSPSDYMGMREWHDGTGGFVWPGAEHPGPSNDTARAWTAPSDGVVDITGHVSKIEAAGNGVVLRITRNGETIWGPRTLAATDQQGFDVDVNDVKVAKGDVIRFEINNNGSYISDATNWDPVIAYQGGASYRASDGFSNVQGANGWRYQDFHSSACAKNSWSETSSSYIPWFSLWDRSNKDGVYMGFDYYGHWAAPIGDQQGGAGSLSLQIPNYDKALSAGEVVHSPKAFVGVYHTDLDDMTNRLLDWQYRYMWDYTRQPYFAGIRMLGYWYNGSQWTGSWDNAGTLQKVFGLSDHMRTVGADTYHRDNGWWDVPGNWDGPDFKQSIDYLAKSGMKQLVYMMAYDANTSSQVYQDHPDWFETGSPCGYADRLIDLTNPSAEKWMGDMLIGKAQQWGDFQWRNDSCPVGPWDGSRQLAQDQAFRRVQQRFLDARPGSALQGVDSGGNEVSYEFLRMASGFSLTDRDGTAEQYDASRLFPADKTSGIPDAWSPGSCDAGFNELLMFNPDFTGDTSDTTRLECMRKLVDLYHYLDHVGVVGRWVRQYHPGASGSARDWFERLSRDGQRGLVIYKGGASSAAVTVHPKGLDPNRTYDVRYELRSGSEQRTGADLMDNGVAFPNGIAKGELVYLGLPNHPGAGTDHTAPTAPGSVNADLGTNMDYRGIEVTWTPGSDDNWVSYYEVLRDGQVIGKVAKGSFYFDHTAGATTTATYAVRAVDGDGNRSPATATHGSADARTSIADDAGTAVTYTGRWLHDTGLADAFDGTLAHTAGSCHSACQGFSNVQGANGWRYQDRIDGTWRDIQNYRDSGYLGQREWHDDPSGGYVWPTGEHPGPDHEAARAWVAPKDGTVDIASHVAKMNTQGNGVVVSITLNDQVIWGPKTIAGTDTEGIDADVSGVSVSAGDVIRFVIANNGDWAYDATAWDPDVTYAGSTPPDNSPASASWTFTGRQVTWYAKLGPDEGKATVSIDGRPQATIDLYAPDDNSWSVPVYSRTFPNADRHTIRITETGEHNQRSSGDAISVDGFQASTPSAAVTEDGAPALTYDGSGWAGRDDADASGGHLTATSHGGDSVSYAFTGRRITWVGRICPGCGEADVYLDGKFVTRVDTYGYRGPTVEQAALFEHSWPTAGAHTIRIVATGSRNFESTGSEVDVDSLQVRPDDDQ